MSTYYPFILIGLVSGSVYALIALGLVLTYRTSGIFNFAQGANAMVGAFAFYSLHVSAHVPTVVAVLLAVIVIAPAFGVLLDRFVFRTLGGTPTGQIVTTVGLLVLLQSVAAIVYGSKGTIIVDPILPTGNVRIGSLNVGVDQIIIMVGVLVLAILLRSFYQYTMLGLNTRALVNSNELAQMEGVRTRLVTATSWAIGCSFAALAGIVLVPTIGLDSTALTLLVLQGLGAAAFGRFTSLPWTYVGALVIGVAAALATKAAATIPVLTGLPDGLPFIVLFIILGLMRKRKSIGSSTMSVLTRVKPVYFRSQRLRVGAWVLWLLALVCLPPLLGSNPLLAATNAAGFAIVFSGLYIVIGLSREVSLCHGVFMALGAVTIAHLAHWHVPYFLALLVGGLIAALAATLVSIPAIRLSGLFFALITFAFALLVEQLIWPTSIGFGATGQVTVPRPSAFVGNRAFYWLVLAVAIVVIFSVNGLVKSRLGRYNRALADSEIALTGLGVRPATVRVLVFSGSAFVAAIGGGLLGSLYSTNTTVLYDYNQSLLFVVVLVTAGVVGQAGVLFSAIGIGALPVLFTWSWLGNWQGVFFGLNAMVYANSAEGIMGIQRKQWLWFVGRFRSSGNSTIAPSAADRRLESEVPANA